MTKQQILFDIIRKKLPKSMNLADVLRELLNIGSDSAYRRIRCEKELTLSEIDKLCGHFQISIDSLLFSYSERVSFRYYPMKEPETYLTYRQHVLNFIRRVASCRNKEAIMLLNDIPYVHYVMFPELQLFKFYSWVMSYQKSSVTYEKFKEQFKMEEHHYYCTEAANAYLRIPSKEIWTNQTIQPLLEMLSYHHDIHSFEREDTFLLLCDNILDLIANLEQYTIHQAKNHANRQTPFELHLYSGAISDICLYKIDNEMMARLKFSDMNAIYTTEMQFCREMETYIRNIMSKSHSLSGSSRRERILFFNEMRLKVRELKNKKY